MAVRIQVSVSCFSCFFNSSFLRNQKIFTLGEYNGSIITNVAFLTGRKEDVFMNEYQPMNDHASNQDGQDRQDAHTVPDVENKYVTTSLLISL